MRSHNYKGRYFRNPLRIKKGPISGASLVRPAGELSRDRTNVVEIAHTTWNMKLDTRKATPARNVEFERASLIALLKAVAKGNRKLHNISAAGRTNRTSTTGRSGRSRCKLWNDDKVNTHFADDLRNRARAVLKATSAGDVQQTVCKLVNRNRVSPYKQRVNYRRDRTINQHRNVSKNLFRR